MNNLKHFFKSLLYIKVFFWTFISLFNTSCIYSQINNIKKDSLLNLIKEQENKKDFTVKDTVYTNLLNKLAIEYTYSTSDTLLTISNKILEYSNAINYDKGKGYAYIGLSNYYLEKGKDTLVFKYLKNAKKIALKTKDTTLLLEVSNHYAIEYDHSGDSSKALKEYLKGKVLAEKIKNKQYLLTIYQNIAVTYSHKKLYRRALKYFNKANVLATKIKDSTSIGITMCNMTRAYIGLNDLDQATTSINKGIKIVEDNDLYEWLGYAYMLKGDILLKEKKHDDALIWYKKSEPIQLSTNYDIGVMDLYNSMAKLYIEKNNIALGKEFAIRACKLAEEIRYPIGISKSAESLSLIYEKLDDDTNALKYHRLFKKMSDSLSKNEQVIGIALLDIENQHKHEQRKLINENNTKVNKQKNLLYFSLITLFILFIIASLIIRNLNTQKKLSEALKVKNEILAFNEKELKKINSTKDKLFSIIGHDLRGPISSLKQLLEATEEESIIKRFIPKLKNDVEHIHFTLNNLLTWGQTQMQGSKVFSKKINLNEIAANNVKLFSDRINKKKLNISLEIPENCNAFADENHIDLVFRNILNNAIKFTEAGGSIKISSKNTNKEVQVFISDTGKGIKKEDIDKLFNERKHFSTYGTSNEKGTGLGLSLCKEMIELNNGKIWVKSEENKGSTFAFSMPNLKKE
ncbi:tetratricopeptide repeat-containing sensor histidine kinase [uncultured Maribacter sp.]|uniref:tetratricopeptide repeat-containing sensor histidine kinase n=1 Tax=uncultured Maribacter sp. TaxID=431308 RepID=UPI00262CE7F0|nr:tetratricopeptide repeat-containing sensor histidine kinase [uncultured Maribacter sp.]